MAERRWRGRTVVLAIALLAGAPAAAQAGPATGKAVAEFAAVEAAVHETMAKVRATAAALAISRDGELLLARGFGFHDRGKIAPTPPDALFRIASISKPFTAAAVAAAVRQGKLRHDAKAFAWIGANPPRGKKLGDERSHAITVRHLLQHRAGWDRMATFDPMFRIPEIRRALQIDRDVTPRDVIAWMLTQPLQFAPGEQEAYSNFGYCVLGRVLEQATGAKSYFAALHELVLEPAAITDVQLGASERRLREVWYAIGSEKEPVLETLDSCGGLIASAPALCAFMDRWWLSGEPRTKEAQHWFFFGSLPGTTAMARQHPAGWNVAVLLNARRPFDFEADNKALQEAVDRALPAAGK